jgi:small subunit ribosomal protein S17e
MGRIKTTLVKRTSRQLIEKTSDTFTSKFGDNSKALGNTMPSKRIRNMIAGYITRIKKNTHKIIEEPKTE